MTVHVRIPLKTTSSFWCKIFSVKCTKRKFSVRKPLDLNSSILVLKVTTLWTVPQHSPPPCCQNFVQSDNWLKLSSCIAIKKALQKINLWICFEKFHSCPLTVGQWQRLFHNILVAKNFWHQLDIESCSSEKKVTTIAKLSLKTCAKHQQYLSSYQHRTLQIDLHFMWHSQSCDKLPT